MKTASIRVVKKNTQKAENLSEMDFRQENKSAHCSHKISSRVKSWVEELREKKDLERAKSFSLLPKNTR
jgi:hypothetical protein